MNIHIVEKIVSDMDQETIKNAFISLKKQEAEEFFNVINEPYVKAEKLFLEEEQEVANRGKYWVELAKANRYVYKKFETELYNELIRPMCDKWDYAIADKYNLLINKYINDNAAKGIYISPESYPKYQKIQNECKTKYQPYDIEGWEASTSYGLCEYEMDIDLTQF